jgi:hypothetical protein
MRRLAVPVPSRAQESHLDTAGAALPVVQDPFGKLVARPIWMRLEKARLAHVLLYAGQYSRNGGGRRPGTAAACTPVTSSTPCSAPSLEP